MEIGGFFGVEAIHRGRGTEANRDGGAARQIEPTQAHEVVRFAATVDALPNPFQRAGIQLCLKCAPGDVGENLAAGGHAHLVVEYAFKLWIHGEDRHCATSVAEAATAHLWMDDELWTVTSARASAKCRQAPACLRTDTAARGGREISRRSSLEGRRLLDGVGQARVRRRPMRARRCRTWADADQVAGRDRSTRRAEPSHRAPPRDTRRSPRRRRTAGYR